MLNDQTLRRLVKQYETHEKSIEVSFRQLLPNLPYGNRLTHFLHSYPGKLLPHIPHFFLNSEIASDRTGLVLDPFCGSGTVLVESVVAGRGCVGIDANPLACLIASVKTTPIAGSVLEAATRRILRNALKPGPIVDPQVVNLKYWFHPHVVRSLGRLLHVIHGEGDENVRRFLLVCFSSVVRRVSLADPRLSVPVRLRSDQYEKTHRLFGKTKDRLEQLKTIDAVDVFREVATQNAIRVNSLHSLNIQANARVVQGDAKRIPLSGRCIPISESVGIAITSPPYAGSQKYIRSSSLSLGWLGLCAPDELKQLDAHMLGREQFHKRQYESLVSLGDRKIDAILRKIFLVDPIRACVASTYLTELERSLSELKRVLTCGGLAIIVLGNSRIAGVEFKTTEFARTIASQIGFKARLVLTDQIHSRGLMTKRNTTASVINQETILMLEKQ